MSERLNLKTLYCKLIPIVENEVNVLGTLMTGDSLHVKRFSDECVRLTLLRDNSDKVKNIIFYEGGIKQLPVNDSNNDSECDQGIASTSRQTTDIIPETDDTIDSGNIADIITPEKNVQVFGKNPSSSKDDLDRTNHQSLEDGNTSSIKYDLGRKNHQSLADSNPSTLEDGNPSLLEDGNPSSLEEGNPSTFKDGNPSSLEEGNPSTFKDGNPSSLKDGNPSSLVDDNPSSFKYDLSGKNHESLEDGNPSKLEDGNPSLLEVEDGIPSILEDVNPPSLEDGNPSSLKYDLGGKTQQSLEDGNPSSLEDGLVIIDGTNHHSLEDDYPSTLKDNLVTIDGTKNHHLLDGNPTPSNDDLAIIHGTNHNSLKNNDSNHSIEDGFPLTFKDNLVTIDGTNHNFLKNNDLNNSLEGGNPSSSNDDLVIIDKTNYHSLEDGYPSTSKDDLLIIDETKLHSLNDSYQSSSNDDLVILDGRNHSFSEDGNTSYVPNELPQIRFISDDHTYTKSKAKRDNPNDEFASDESDSDEEPLHFMKIVNGTNKLSLDRSSSSINYVVNTLINNCIQILALDGLNDSETNDDTRRNLNLGLGPLTVGTGENLNFSVGYDEITSLNSGTDLNPSVGIVTKPNFTVDINETDGIDAEKNEPVGVTSISNPDIGVLNHNQIAEINLTHVTDAELNPSDSTANVHASKQSINFQTVKNLVGAIANPNSDDKIATELSPSVGSALEHNPSDGAAPEHNSFDGNIPEHNPSHGTAPEHYPSDGTASEHNPFDGNAPEHNPSDGTAPEHYPSDGTASEHNPFDGNAPENNPSHGTAPEHYPSDGTASEHNPFDSNAPEPNPSDGSAPEHYPFVENTVDPNKITEVHPQLNQPDITHNVKKTAKEKINTGSAEKPNQIVEIIENLNTDVKSIAEYKLSDGTASEKIQSDGNAGATSNLNQSDGTIIKLNLSPKTADNMNAKGAEKRHADVIIADHTKLKDKATSRCNSVVGSSENSSNLNASVSVHEHLEFKIPDAQHSYHQRMENFNSELGSTAISNLKPDIACPKSEVTTDPTFENYTTINLNQQPKIAESFTQNYIDVADPILISETSLKLNSDSVTSKNVTIELGISESNILKPEDNSNSNLNLGIADMPGLITETYVQVNPNIRTPGMAESSQLNEGVDDKSNLNVEIVDNIRVVAKTTSQLNSSVETAENLSHYPRIAETFPLNEEGNENSNINLGIADKPNIGSGINVKPCLIAEETIQLNSTIEITDYPSLDPRSGVKPSIIADRTEQLNATIETARNTHHNPGIAENSYLSEGVEDLKLNLQMDVHPSLKEAGTNLDLNSGIAVHTSLEQAATDINLNFGIADKPNLDPGPTDKSSLIAGTSLQMNPTFGIAENPNTNPGIDAYSILLSGNAENLNPIVGISENQNFYSQTVPITNLNNDMSFNLKSKSTNRLVIIETPVHSNPNLESIPLLQLFQNLNSSKNQHLASDYEIKSPFENEKMKRKPSVKTYESKNKRFKRTPLKVQNCSEIIESIMSNEIDYSRENDYDCQQIDTSNYWTIDPLYRSIGYFDTNNHLEFEDHLNKVVFNSFERLSPSGKELIDFKTESINSTNELDFNNIEIVDLSSDPTTSNNINFKFSNGLINNNNFFIIDPNDLKERKMETGNPMQLSDRISNENIIIDNDKDVNINLSDVNVCFMVNNNSSKLTGESYYTKGNALSENCQIFSDFKPFSNINIENQIPNINIENQIPNNIRSGTNDIVPNFKQFSNIYIENQSPINTISNTNETVPNFKTFSSINIENQIPTYTSSVTNEIVANFKTFSNINIENQIPTNTSSGTNKMLANFKTFSNVNNDSKTSTITNSNPKINVSNEILSNFKSSIITSFIDLSGPDKPIKSIIKCKRNLIKKKVRFNLPEENSECNIESTNENSKCSLNSTTDEKSVVEINSNKPTNISSLGNKSYSRNVYGSKRKTNLKYINHSFFNSRNIGKSVNCNDKQSVFCKNKSVSSKYELNSSKNESFNSGLESISSRQELSGLRNESLNPGHELISSRTQYISSKKEPIGSSNESFNNEHELFNSSQESISSRSESIGSKRKSFSSRMELFKNRFNRVSPAVSNKTGISNVEGSKTQLNKNNSDKTVVKNKNNQSGMKLNNEISLSQMNQGLKVPAIKSYQKVNRKFVGNKDTKEISLLTGNRDMKEISSLTGNKDMKEISLMTGIKDLKEVSTMKENKGITEISLINEDEGKNETLVMAKSKEMSVFKGNKNITEISLIREDEGKHKIVIPKEGVDKKEILLLIKKKKDVDKVPMTMEEEVDEDYLVETMVITEGKEGGNEIKVLDSDKDVNGDSSSMVIKNDDCKNEISVMKEGGNKNETWVMKEYKIINDSLVQEDKGDTKKKSVKKPKLNAEVFSIYNDVENPDLIIIETINENVPTKVIKHSEKLCSEKPSSETVDLEKPALNCHYCKFKTKYKTSIIRHLASKHFDEMGLKGKKTYTYRKKYKVINGNKLKLKIVNVPKKRGRKKLKKNMKIEQDNTVKKGITRKRKLVFKNDSKTSTQTARKKSKMESWQVESIVSGLCQNIINKESVETTRIGSNNVKIGFRSKRRENSVVNSSKKQFEVAHLPKRVLVKRSEEEIEKYKIRCIRCNDDNVYTENQLRMHLLEKHEKNVSSSVKLICSLCFTAFDDLVGHMKLNHPDTTFNINPCSLFG